MLVPVSWKKSIKPLFVIITSPLINIQAQTYIRKKHIQLKDAKYKQCKNLKSERINTNKYNFTNLHCANLPPNHLV